MKLEYIPLLPVMKRLLGMPRNYERFREYVRTIFPRDEEADQLLPLLTMNPMGKDHVTARVDELLAMEADRVAEEAMREAASRVGDIPCDYHVGLVVADDLLGGWTNRYANEFTNRFGPNEVRGLTGPRPRPPWLKDYWIMCVLWSSEEPSLQKVRETVRCAIFRMAYGHEHGPARTLREMMAQEGTVMARAGCSEPTLDAEDLEYTREVLEPELAATDMRTCMECLFGDKAGATLGFSPRGLSPWAGLALGLYQAKVLSAES